MSDQPAADIQPPVKVLVMIFDARDEWQGEPLHEALVRVLEARGVAGATALSGITGFGMHGRVHRKGLIGQPRDEPIALLVIENEAKLRSVLPSLRPMVAEGIFVLLDGEVIPFV